MRKKSVITVINKTKIKKKFVYIICFISKPTIQTHATIYNNE